jgi:hypothetical protein
MIRVRFFPAEERRPTSRAWVLARCAGCGLRRFLEPPGSALPRMHGAGAGAARWIEERDDPVAALREARDRLAPGCPLDLEAADAGSLAARLLGGAWPGWAPGRQRVVFDRRTLRRALAAAGLTSGRIERGWGGVLRVRAWAA